MHVLHIRYSDGDCIIRLFQERAAADAALAEYVRDNWNEDILDEAPEGDQDAIAAYLDYWYEQDEWECFSISEVEVE